MSNRVEAGEELGEQLAELTDVARSCAKSQSITNFLLVVLITALFWDRIPSDFPWNVVGLVWAVISSEAFYSGVLGLAFVGLLIFAFYLGVQAIRERNKPILHIVAWFTFLFSLSAFALVGWLRS